MSNNKSLVLIADNSDITEAVTKAVDHLEDVTLELHEGTLASANGSAARMLSQHDLVVFRLSEVGDRDLVKQLRSKVGAGGSLMALSDKDISLNEARDLKKSGVDEILPFPIAQEELEEQIERLSGKNSMLPAIYDPDLHRLGHVIAVCPAQGGLGASTLAVNLADQLQGHSGLLKKTRKNKVAIVDLDLQFGSISSALDVEPSPGLTKLIQDQNTPDRTFLKQCMIEHETGLDILSAPEEFMPMNELAREQIDALINILRKEYDYVVIDLPRCLVEWLGAVVSSCDRMLMLTESSVPSIRQSCRLVDFFARERLEPPIEMVVGHESKPLFRAGHHTEAEKALGRDLRYWLPFDPKPARTALDRGQPLSKVANSSALSKAIRGIARTILEDTQLTAGKQKHTAA